MRRRATAIAAVEGTAAAIARVAVEGVEGVVGSSVGKAAIRR
jgi:hypothetical protein